MTKLSKERLDEIKSFPKPLLSTMMELLAHISALEAELHPPLSEEINEAEFELNKTLASIRLKDLVDIRKERARLARRVERLRGTLIKISNSVDESWRTTDDGEIAKQAIAEDDKEAGK